MIGSHPLISGRFAIENLSKQTTSGSAHVHACSDTCAAECVCAFRGVKRMNERVVVAQATSLQVANLVQPRVLKVTKPQSDQSITLDLDLSAKLDLSAVADENMTFVHAGTKLVIQFDNQSTVIADPFFDSTGRPVADLNIELGGGRAVTGEQFAQLVSETVGQSALFDDDNILPSGAHFNDPFID